MQAKIFRIETKAIPYTPQVQEPVTRQTKSTETNKITLETQVQDINNAWVEVRKENKKLTHNNRPNL